MGHLDVSKFYVKEVDEILTPNVWASFLTGVPPQIHKAYTFSTVRWRRLNSIRRKITKLLPTTLREPVSRILRKTGVIIVIDREYLHSQGLSTVFDEVNSIVLNDFPTYNPTEETRNRMLKAAKQGIKEYIAECWRINKERKARLLSLLKDFPKSNYDLLAAYFDIADKVSHVYYPRGMIEVIKAYFFLNKLVYEVKQLIPDNVFVLIISDHGMEPGGKHSPRAFYSLSHKVNYIPTTIEDFKSFILKVIHNEINIGD